MRPPPINALYEPAKAIRVPGQGGLFRDRIRYPFVPSIPIASTQ
jgi:hypothetical protein